MTDKLLDHFKGMQARAAMYIEPSDYTSLDGKTIATEQDASGAAKHSVARDSLFISDMIYMLDGPEQREAQAAAEFPIDAPINAVRPMEDLGEGHWVDVDPASIPVDVSDPGQVAEFERRYGVDPRTLARKQSSPELSTLAAEMMAKTGPGKPWPDIVWLIANARKLAGSVLSQDETPGQKAPEPKRSMTLSQEIDYRYHGKVPVEFPDEPEVLRSQDAASIERMADTAVRLDDVLQNVAEVVARPLDRQPETPALAQHVEAIANEADAEVIQHAALQRRQHTREPVIVPNPRLPGELRNGQENIKGPLDE